MTQKGSKMVNSVARAAEILVSLSEGKYRLTDISQDLHLNKTTTYRLLKTLESYGFVVQDPISHKYLLGHLILKISSNPIIANQSLIVCAYEEMKRLRDKSGETVTLHVRVGTQRICLEEIQSQKSAKYIVGKGSVSPIYAGSAGKILLAELDKEELQLLLKNIRLVAVGPNTITDKNILDKELEKIRKLGYAISWGETLEGAISISIQIKGYTWPVALSIFGPKFRIGRKLMMFKKEMEKSADRISKNFAKLGKRLV